MFDQQLLLDCVGSILAIPWVALGRLHASVSLVWLDIWKWTRVPTLLSCAAVTQMDRQRMAPVYGDMWRWRRTAVRLLRPQTRRRDVRGGSVRRPVSRQHETSKFPTLQRTAVCGLVHWCLVAGSSVHILYKKKQTVLYAYVMGQNFTSVWLKTNFF